MPQPIERPAPDAIAANGWVFYEKCRCQRILKYKYRHPAHPDLELEWWPNTYQFKITYQATKTKVPPTSIKKLSEILQAI